MGKYNDLLLEYMQRKNAIVKKHSGLVLTRKRDLAELRTWSEQMCSTALRRLSITSDSLLCPWCIVTDLDCVTCNYGKRNGICNDVYTKPQPRYRKIRIRLLEPTRIYELPGMFDLVTEIRYLYYKMCKIENTQ